MEKQAFARTTATLVLLSVVIGAFAVLGPSVVSRLKVMAASDPGNGIPADAQRLSELNPQPGSALTIPAGQTVLWDTNVVLKSLEIDGTFACADKDVTLSAQWIVVQNKGHFLCGTEQAPFTKQATITLVGPRSDDNVMEMCGTKTICAMMGGKIDWHGIPHQVTWTKLSTTAEAGATELTLDKPVDWPLGAHIVLASSSSTPAEAEELTISQVNGTKISLASPLKYTHLSMVETFAGQTIDERVEVGLLSHNIVIQGDEASEQDKFGCHVMIHKDSQAYVSGIELNRCGQYSKLGRYPIHWHLVDDASGQYFKQSSVHHSYHRFVTLHGSSNILVQDNVAFDGMGTGYYLENGNETNDVFDHNLGILVHPIPDSESTAPVVENSPSFSDNKKHDWMPAIFYTINPNNIFRNNAAAGAEEGFGFWFDAHSKCPDKMLAGCGTAYDNGGVKVGRLGDFTGNSAHGMSQADDAHRTDYDVNGTGLYMTNFDIAYNRFVFRNFTAFNNDAKGVVGVGRIIGGKFANNAVTNHGALAFEDTLIVGKSNDFASRGYYMHGLHVGWNGGWATAKNVTFAEFNDSPGAAAIFFNQGDSNMTFPYGVADAGSAWFPAVQGLNFTNVARRVYMNPQDHQTSTENFAIEDLDGSLARTGTPGSVVFNAPITITNKCSVRTDLAAAFCPYGATAIDGTNLVRDDGVTHNGAEGWYQTTAVAPNHSYDMNDNRSSFFLADSKQGEWLKISVPAGNTTSVAINGQPVTAVPTMAALDTSNGTAYFLSNGRVYIKVVFDKPLMLYQDPGGLAENYQAKVELS